jgi:HSP20 family molecular chaperone IbpA
MTLTTYFSDDTLSGLAALDRFFDDAFNPRGCHLIVQDETFRPRCALSSPATLPRRHAHPCHRMNVHYDEDTNNVNVDFELPGLQKEDVAIDVHNNVLTVSGKNKASSERSEGGYVVRECRDSKFMRRLSLPQGVKVSRLDTILSSRDTDIFMCRMRTSEHQ